MAASETPPRKLEVDTTPLPRQQVVARTRRRNAVRLSNSPGDPLPLPRRGDPLAVGDDEHGGRRTRRHGLVESRMRWKPHVRFGERAEETARPKGRNRAPARLHLATSALDEVRRGHPPPLERTDRSDQHHPAPDLPPRLRLPHSTSTDRARHAHRRRPPPSIPRPRMNPRKRQELPLNPPIKAPRHSSSAPAPPKSNKPETSQSKATGV